LTASRQPSHAHRLTSARKRFYDRQGKRRESRGQASVRVHVEHGIRRVKAFKIARENYRHAIGLFSMVASAVVGLVHLNRILG
jgi:hypothetical protein